jgi:hypothetical protein
LLPFTVCTVNKSSDERGENALSCCFMSWDQPDK